MASAATFEGHNTEQSAKWCRAAKPPFEGICLLPIAEPQLSGNRLSDAKLHFLQQSLHLSHLQQWRETSI